MDTKTRDTIKNLPDSIPLAGAGEPHEVHTRVFIDGISAEEYERLKGLKRELITLTPKFGIDMDPIILQLREDGAIVRPGSETPLGWKRADGSIRWNFIANPFSWKEHD